MIFTKNFKKNFLTKNTLDQQSDLLELGADYIMDDFDDFYEEDIGFRGSVLVKSRIHLNPETIC